MKTYALNSLRRQLCAGAAALALIPAAVMAQAYPNKPVRIIVNNPAGGPTDILARATAEALQKKLNQSFVVDNKTGAGGNVGADALAKSPADGYNLMISFDTTLTVNPHIYKGLPFQPADLRPVVVLASSGLLVGAASTTGITSFQGLVEAMRRKPLNFASGGNGSPGHLAIEVFRETGKFNIQHVPYRGNNPAVTAIVAGETDAGVLATPGMLPHVKSGKIHALASTDFAAEGQTGQAARQRLDEQSARYARIAVATGMRPE